MSPDKNKSAELVKEYLSSWKVGKVIDLALKDEEVLLTLFRLLHAGDDELKIRALTALEDVFKVLPDVKRLILVEKFLDDLIKLLESDSDGVLIHTIRTIGRLIEGVPLQPEKFVKLAHAFKDLIKSRKHEAVLLEIPPVLKVMRPTSYTPKLMDAISRLLKSSNPRLKAMGLRLLLNAGAFTGNPSFMKTFFSEIYYALQEREDIPLVDFCLDLLLEVIHYPLRDEFMDEIAYVLTAVKEIAIQKNSELTEKARTVAEKLELAIRGYYSKNPERAKEKIHELLVNERFYEAVDLALAVGDEYVLKWLVDVLEKFGRETLMINARVLPGPKYASVPPEKKAQRYLTPPTLAQFKGEKKSTGAASFNEASSRRKLSKEEMAGLERALKAGDEETLVELSRKNIEAVFELVHRLEGGDELEKMDSLWALSKLAERIEPEAAFVLEPVVEGLLKLARSTKNRWMGQRASKTLALLASKSRTGDKIVEEFLDDYLSGDVERVVPALEFFGCYFERVWDEKTARAVLPHLQDYLKKEETRFDALLTLEGLVRLAPPDRAGLFLPFVEVLKAIKKSALPQDQKLAMRILEDISSKIKAELLGPPDF